MRDLLARWIHDERGYMDEYIIVVLFFIVLLATAIRWLLDSGLMSRLGDILVGLLSSILR